MYKYYITTDETNKQKLHENKSCGMRTKIINS